MLITSGASYIPTMPLLHAEGVHPIYACLECGIPQWECSGGGGGFNVKGRWLHRLGSGGSLLGLRDLGFSLRFPLKPLQPRCKDQLTFRREGDGVNGASICLLLLRYIVYRITTPTVGNAKWKRNQNVTETTCMQ